MIHIMSTYIIDEYSKDADLLENEYILLLLLIHMKLQDWITLNILHKCDQSQKLITDNDDVNALKNYTNYKKNLLLFKKTKKNISALF